ncbi:MAG: hypothetical protein RDV48_00900 [Candidatus Eremiobacteraeota bacterium]|nr:hypothetical protein [Candidatus Eremiobacteraeota bacterium]
MHRTTLEKGVEAMAKEKGPAKKEKKKPKTKDKKAKSEKKA